MEKIMSMLDRTLAQLAQELPGATAIFHQYRLSFCCGGEHTLREAATKRGVDVKEIADALSALPGVAKGAKGVDTLSDADLIEFILNRFHKVHREQLTELKRLAHRVESVHGDNPACPHGLTEFLHHLALELEQHMQKEEAILFPMLIQGEGGMAGGPMRVMMAEHEGHVQELARLDELTGGCVPPEGACNTWRALYLGLKAFVADLAAHIHLENDILFARNLKGAFHG